MSKPGWRLDPASGIRPGGMSFETGPSGHPGMVGGAKLNQGSLDGNVFFLEKLDGRLPREKGTSIPTARAETYRCAGEGGDCP